MGSSERAIKRLYKLRQKVEQQELWYDLDSILTLPADDLPSGCLDVSQGDLAVGL